MKRPLRSSSLAINPAGWVQVESQSEGTDITDGCSGLVWALSKEYAGLGTSSVLGKAVRSWNGNPSPELPSEQGLCNPVVACWDLQAHNGLHLKMDKLRSWERENHLPEAGLQIPTEPGPQASNPQPPVRCFTTRKSSFLPASTCRFLCKSQRLYKWLLASN